MVRDHRQAKNPVHHKAMMVSPSPSENGDVTLNPLLNDEEDLSPMDIGDVGPSWRNDGEEGLSPSDNELLLGWLSSDNREDEGPDNDAREKLHKKSRYCRSRCMATICIQPTSLP